MPGEEVGKTFKEDKRRLSQAWSGEAMTFLLLQKLGAGKLKRRRPGEGATGEKRCLWRRGGVGVGDSVNRLLEKPGLRKEDKEKNVEEEGEEKPSVYLVP